MNSHVDQQSKVLELDIIASVYRTDWEKRVGKDVRM